MTDTAAVIPSIHKGWCFPPTGVESRRNYRIILLRTLRDHRHRLDPGQYAALRRHFEDGTEDTRHPPDEPEDLAALAVEILGPGSDR